MCSSAFSKPWHLNVECVTQMWCVWFQCVIPLLLVSPQVAGTTPPSPLLRTWTWQSPSCPVLTCCVSSETPSTPCRYTHTHTHTHLCLPSDRLELQVEDWQIRLAFNSVLVFTHCSPLWLVVGSFFPTRMRCWRASWSAPTSNITLATRRRAWPWRRWFCPTRLMCRRFPRTSWGSTSSTPKNGYEHTLVKILANPQPLAHRLI